MTCPKCHGENVTVQVVSEQNLKEIKKRHSLAWWVCISWWWIPIKWILFTVPAFLLKFFKPKKYKIKTKHYSMCVCQDCGHHWKTR